MADDTMPTEPLPGAAPPADDPPDLALLEEAARRRTLLADLLARATAAGDATGLADAELVHDVRVAARRLTEVARLLGVFMDRPTAKAVRATLRAVRQSAGELRDLDVTCLHLAKWSMPAAVRAVAREVSTGLAAQRGSLLEAARAQMGSASVAGAMVVLAQVIDQQRTPALAAGAVARLRHELMEQMKKRRREMRRAFGRAARKMTAESLHGARIAVKRLRYVMELADAAKLERGTKKQLRFLKQMQELLGEHHDVHVILGMLQGHLRDPRAKPIRNLGPMWRKWRRMRDRRQTKRAVAFLMKSYAWVNA